MAKDHTRKQAEVLYCESDLTQKEIAQQLGISEKTLSGWKEKFGWDKIRAARRTTKSEIINQLYKAINKIVEDAHTADRELSAADADKIHKLSASIEKMEQGKNLATYVMVIQELMEYLRGANLEVAKMMIEYSKEFLHQKTKRR